MKKPQVNPHTRDYPQIEKLAQSALELIEKIEQYETELLNLEHCVYDSESGRYLCPVCGGKELDGHFSDCRLGKLLKENNIAK
jgi:rubrerythrin